MSIDLEIQDEQGCALARYEGPILGLPFLRLASPGSSCFRFILPWADTTFNQEQIKVLRGELCDALSSTDDPSRLPELRSVIQFIEGASGAHVYIKFIGD